MSMGNRRGAALTVVAVTLGGVVIAQQGRQLLPRQSGAGTTVIEFEALAPTAAASAGAVRVQDMGGFGGGWSGGAQLFWAPPAPVEQPVRSYPHLTLTFAVPQAGPYRVVLAHTVAPDFGRFRIFLNGQQRQDISGWAAGVALRVVEIGQVTLRAGTNQMVVTVFGKDPQSSNYFVGLDRLELYPVVPPAQQPPDPPVEQPPAPQGSPARAVEEAIVIDLAGSKARFLKAGEPGGETCWSANWTFDIPMAPESFFYVGNFDGEGGDDLLQWHHLSGEWFLITFDAGARKARRQAIAGNDPFRGAGRSERAAYLTGRHDRAGIVRNAQDMGMHLLRVNEQPVSLWPKAAPGISVAALDVDGDQRDEVIFYDERGSGTLDVLKLVRTPVSGESGASPHGQLTRIASAWGAGLRFATGDFDGDGRAELLAHDTSSREVFIAAFDATGKPGPRRRVASGWPESRWWTRAVDFGGDGRDDLLVHDRQTGVVELVRFAGPDGQAVASHLLQGVGPEDAFYPGYFLAGTGTGRPAASFLWYSKPEPVESDGLLALLETRMMEGKLRAYGQCPTNTPFPPYGVVFVGDFALESAITPTAPAAATDPPAAGSSWTAKDAIDSRIDVDAQRSLQRMLKAAADMRDASAMLDAVKGGRLAGIYREDQQQPAIRAQKTGKGWWQLFAGQPPDRLAFCWKEPPGQPPMIVMRRAVKSTPSLDAALRAAWMECGIP
jgi:hypothetical protein